MLTCLNDVKTALPTHQLGKIQLIICVRTGQRCNQSSSIIHDDAFEKHSYQR